MKDYISIKGAREHNLKNISLDIPKNKLVIISGVSGSGKSSLAFNTIYAEAQRKYLESLSVHAKQFLEKLQKPDVDSIEGLNPAIAIEQKPLHNNPRSTVGTITEIYDYLRVLFAECGQPWCEKHKKYAKKHTIQSITNDILKLPLKTKVQILIPIGLQQTSAGRAAASKRKLLDSLRKSGFVRVRINKQIFSLDEEISIEPDNIESIEIVFDRLIIKEDIALRLSESIEKALEKASEKNNSFIKILLEHWNGKQEERIISEKFACEDCQISLPELTPSMFSFGSPHGACPACHGLASVMDIDPGLIIPDPSKTIAKGALKPFSLNKKMFNKFRGALKRLCTDYGFDYSMPWDQFPDCFRKIILFGETADSQAKLKSEKISPKKRGGKTLFAGLSSYLKTKMHQTKSAKMRQDLAAFMKEQPCPDCNGSRLAAYPMSIRFGGKNIYELSCMPLTELHRFLTFIKIEPNLADIASPLIKPIISRLEFLIDNGVGYLTLARNSATLSGGEAQRIKLAGQLGSGLSGIIYVLDEPSIGLHPADIGKLINNLCQLRNLGNSVIVVEHDEQIIKRADYLIDIGQDAGTNGGRIVALGTPMEVAKNELSYTGQLISGNLPAFTVPIPIQRATIKVAPTTHQYSNHEQHLTLTNVSQNNLKSVTVSFPLGKLICVTGPSGSGKSSLISQTLYPALAKMLNNNHSLTQGKFADITGTEHIDKIINIDQSPLGKTPRSNPATYTGIFSVLRDIFSSVPQSRVRGYTAGRFSFNVKGGRCETCKGDGAVRTEMHFLPDVYVECADCRGQRYNDQTLEILYKGLNIADVLNLTIESARETFKNHAVLLSKLDTLCSVGLGYIKLGQPTDTLSGGENQRLKLASELSKKQTGSTLYILDEPTSGLHAVDIQKLLSILHQLVGYGNTVLVIEHNPYVIKTADWIIDLGPEGGDKGGYIIDAGTPADIKLRGRALIGKYL